MTASLRRQSECPRLLAVFGLLLASALLIACAEADAPPTRADLEQATYLTENTDAGEATLEDGEFREPLAPGSAGELIIQLGKWATGDLDGAGATDAAAITIEQTGGSGTFYFLHALTADNDELADAGAAFLGDRIRVEGVSIHDGAITVALLDRAPEAAMASEPTVAVIRRFTLQNGALVELDPDNR